jgi:hypothetical protein
MIVSDKCTSLQYFSITYYLNKLECLPLPFASALVFGDKAGAYQRGIPYDIPLYGRFLALPANIRLKWT